jgi:preprotein translocase subunit SecF
MELFKPSSKVVDFMRYQRVAGVTSLIVTLASAVGVFWPGPNYGIDFRGGTELEVALKSKTTSGELRQAVESLGYNRPDVIAVGAPEANRFILRIQEVSSLPPQQAAKIEAGLKRELGTVALDGFRVSPGGDKIALRLSDSMEPEAIRTALESAGARVRNVAVFGQAQDHRYEAMLVGIGDELVRGLKSKLGARAPESPMRVEWVGPKAGEQLRTAALKSLLYAMAFIMVYVAFRFDLRFAPGGVIALVHDVTVVAGMYVLLQKEFTLGTVAAMLTVVGYSINDTIVIYDRIRENMARTRDAGLYQLINVSTTQTMSRTIITSGVTLLSILGFFIWGTPVIQDVVFALTVGFVTGTYSSIYIAAPFTEWMDRVVFKRA